MKVNFNPERQVKGLVLERLSDNGKELKRVFEIPGKKPKTLDVTYKKSEFLPTEWYVSNYNLRRRDANSTLLSSMKATNPTKGEFHRVIKNIDPRDGKVTTTTINEYENGYFSKTVDIKKNNSFNK